MSATITEATLRDLEELHPLYEEFFSYHANQQPEYYRETPMDESYARSVIKSGRDALLVAREGERIVGFAVVGEKTTPPYLCLVPHRYAQVVDLCVAPGLRSQGLGAALMDAAKAWARERGLDYVELKVLATNEAAIRFYRREGFSTVDYNMRCPL